MIILIDIFVAVIKSFIKVCKDKSNYNQVGDTQGKGLDQTNSYDKVMKDTPWEIEPSSVKKNSNKVEVLKKETFNESTKQDPKKKE